MSQFLTRPTPKLIDAAYRVMGHLLKTKEQTITYQLPCLHYTTEFTLHVMQDGQDALSHDKAKKATSFGTTADQSLGDQIDKKQSHSQLPKPNLSAS